MSNYIPHHTKKKQRMKKLEAKLRRLIKKGDTEEKILKSATQIRDARVLALEAKKDKLPPLSSSVFKAQRINREIIEVYNTSPKQIAEEFGLTQD